MTEAAFPDVDRRLLAPLTAGMPCLHGVVAAVLHGRGTVWADAPLRPRGAVAAIGDFLLCAGEAGPSAVRLLRTAIQAGSGMRLLYAPGGWRDAAARIDAFPVKSRRAFAPEVQPEPEQIARILSALPENGRVVPIEGERINWCRGEAWSRDFVSVYASNEDFAENGLGVLLTVDGEPVAGASSYVSAPGSLEVQVQTREGWMGRGYATAVAAALIQRAQARGITAYWDAANPVSERVAVKLGYRPAALYEVLAVGGETNG